MKLEQVYEFIITLSQALPQKGDLISRKNFHLSHSSVCILPLTLKKKKTLNSQLANAVISFLHFPEMRDKMLEDLLYVALSGRREVKTRVAKRVFREHGLHVISLSLFGP